MDLTNVLSATVPIPQQSVVLDNSEMMENLGLSEKRIVQKNPDAEAFALLAQSEEAVS